MASRALQNPFVHIPRGALVFSVLFHGAVVGILLMTSAFDLSLPFVNEQKDIQEKVDNFIQVDVVALPDQLLKDETAVDTTLPLVDAVKKEIDPAAETKEQEDLLRLEAENKAKAEEVQKLKEKEELAKKKLEEKKRLEEQANALKQLREEAKRDAALKALSESAGKEGRGKLAGNKLSQGTALKGAIGDAKDKWASRVAQQIKNHFNIFPWQNKKGLRVVIQLQLFPTGRLRERKVLSKSQDATYDSAALQAADNAQPFALPEDPELLAQPLIIELKAEEQ